METATLSFENLHTHGELFANIFRARRQSFIVQNKWDLPEALGMEYDQYDTPASRWLAVHHLGKVMAGIRLTPTTARCGIYTYMIRDAQIGLLDTIPNDLLDFPAPIDPYTWEASRGFVAHDVPQHLRRKVHFELVKLMIGAARQEGIGQMLTLIPSNWTRWTKRCMLNADAAGPVMDMGGILYQSVRFDFSAHMH
ncbi:MAG: acyl-homoserine-lactone synthase [Pseudomonadota bacterium]